MQINIVSIAYRIIISKGNVIVKINVKDAYEIITQSFI